MGQDNLSLAYCTVSCVALIGICIPNSPCWALSAAGSREAARSVVSKGKKTAAPATTLFLFLFIPCWQSSIQDWGEEVEEGAVYHVTLKRVQIQQAANKGARWLGVSRAS